MIATTSEGRKRCNGGHLDGIAYKDDRRKSHDRYNKRRTQALQRWAP